MFNRNIRSQNSNNSYPVALHHLGYYLPRIREMWLFVGMTVLLSRAVMANLTDESSYYLAESNDDRSLDSIEKPRYEKSELENSDATSSSETEDDHGENRPGDESVNNRDVKRSFNNDDSGDKSSGQRQAPAPLATLLYWPEREDEVVGMEQRRNPLMQDRRNPAFSPWGGKRDVQQRYKTITKIRRPVRVPFNSWGGKRDGEIVHPYLSSDLKKEKFFNWGDKKAPNFNSWGGKRTPNFNSWGGKRTPNFNSWGGKRAPNFNSWGGKRAPNFNSWGGKRAPNFNSWGGKRITDDFTPSTNDHYYQRHRKSLVMNGQPMSNDFDSTEENNHDDLINNEMNEKRGSLKLIANGEITTSGSTMGENFSRIPFEPWGGKKRKHLESVNDAPRSASLSVILCKMGKLIPSNG